MADPTKLVDFAKKRRDALATKLTAAREKADEQRSKLFGQARHPDELDAKEIALADKQAELAALPADAPANDKDPLVTAINNLKAEIQTLETQIGAQQLVKHRMNRLTELERQIESTRKQIAQAPTGADADSLADELTRLSIQFATACARLLEAEQNLTTVQAEFDSAQKQLQRHTTALAAAEAFLKAETARQEEYLKLIALLGEDPLSQLRARATAILAVEGGNANAADGDDLAKAKAAVVKAKERIKSDFPDDLLAKLKDRVNETLDDLDAKRKALEDAEQGLADQRSATQGPAAAVAARRLTFEKAQAALTAHIRQGPTSFEVAIGLLEGIGASPPLTDPQQASLDNAALPTAERKAAVPNHIWWNLIHYLQAKRTLERLAQDPKALQDARDKEEGLLGAALVEEAEAEQKLESSLDAVWQKRPAAAFAESAGQRLVFEAVRGEP